MRLIFSEPARNLPFMVLEVSLACLQEPATGTYREPAEMNPTIRRYFIKIDFNITFLHTFKSSKLSFPFTFPTKIFVHLLSSRRSNSSFEH